MADAAAHEPRLATDHRLGDAGHRPPPPFQPVDELARRQQLAPDRLALFDHYRLGTVARGQVKAAVFGRGQVPGERTLQQAARLGLHFRGGSPKCALCAA